MARPTRRLCTECGARLEEVARLSYFFGRPLCEACYHAETQRSKADAEVWLLEQLFKQSAA